MECENNLPVSKTDHIYHSLQTDPLKDQPIGFCVIPNTCTEQAQGWHKGPCERWHPDAADLYVAVAFFFPFLF